MKLKTLRGLSVSLTMLNAVAAGAAILPTVPATQAAQTGLRGTQPLGVSG